MRVPREDSGIKKSLCVNIVRNMRNGNTEVKEGVTLLEEEVPVLLLGACRPSECE